MTHHDTAHAAPNPAADTHRQAATRSADLRVWADVLLYRMDPRIRMK